MSRLPHEYKRKSNPLIQGNQSISIHLSEASITGNKYHPIALSFLSSPKTATYFAIGGPFGHCRPAGTNPFLSRSQAGDRSVQMKPRPILSGDSLKLPKSRLPGVPFRRQARELTRFGSGSRHHSLFRASVCASHGIMRFDLLLSLAIVLFGFEILND